MNAHEGPPHRMHSDRRAYVIARYVITANCNRVGDNGAKPLRAKTDATI